MKETAEYIAGPAPGRWVACKQVYAITVGLSTVSVREGAIVITWQDGDETIYARFVDKNRAKSFFSSLALLT